MLHRIMIRLYDENPMDAEVLDYLADFDGKRRQDILRTLIRMGFNTLNSSTGKKAIKKVAEEDASALVEVAESALLESKKPVRGTKTNKPSKPMSKQTVDVKTPVEAIEEAVVPTVRVDPRKFIASQLQDISVEEKADEVVETVEKDTVVERVETVEDKTDDGQGDSSASDAVMTEDDFNPLSVLAKKFS